jgi:hypothetical protein
LAQLETAAKPAERSRRKDASERCGFSDWVKRKRTLLGPISVPKKCRLLT